MVTQPPALRNRGPGRVVTSAGYVTSQDTVTWHPRAQTYAAISLPNGYRNWIQGGRASLSGGGPIRFPPSSPLGASVNPARRCGLTTHGRISDCRHGTARTRLGTQEGQSSIGCAAALGGVSLELCPGRGASRVSAVPPGPARPQRTSRHHWTTRHPLDAGPATGLGSGTGPWRTTTVARPDQQQQARRAPPLATGHTHNHRT